MQKPLAAIQAIQIIPTDTDAPVKPFTITETLAGFYAPISKRKNDTAQTVLLVIAAH